MNVKNKNFFGKKSIVFLAIVVCFGLLWGVTSSAVTDPFSGLSLDGGSSDSLGSTSKGTGGSGLSGWVVGGFLDFLRSVAAVCLAKAMDTLDLMLSDRMYSEVFFSPRARDALGTGWGLVRDFVNMFYILILVFLAIATILRVNRFSDKKLIISVVLSALLVNFSQVITFVFVDASNLAMNFFIGQISQANASFTALMADQMKIQSLFNGNSYFRQEGAYTAAFFEIIFTFIFAVTVFVLAAALIIRLVALWVLIVLSPLAFFGLALPGTSLSNLWSGWLSKLTNYAFFGPVLLFFLWLSLILITALARGMETTSIAGANSSSPAGNGQDTFVFNFFKNVIPYVASIYMLFYGFSLSKDMAAKAGNAVGSLMGKGENWMKKSAKYAAIAGTGVGVGYLGYKAATSKTADKLTGGRSTAVATGLKERGKRMLGIKDEDAKKKRNERLKAKLTGGTAAEEYDRKSMNEQLKEWKDNGDPSAEEQARINQKGSKSERMALAMHRAEKGRLNTPDDYRRAMEIMGNDRMSQNKLRALAEKKNLNAVMQADIQSANAAVASGNDARIDQEIAGNAALREMIRIENENRRARSTNPSAYQDMDAAAQRAYISRLGAPALEQQAYDNKLRTMSLPAMGEQDIGFFSNPQVVASLQRQRGSLSTLSPAEQRRKQQEMRRFASSDKNMTAAKEHALRTARLI